MATITEDYVSFETAKLLKEKGFDERCRYVWELDKANTKDDTDGRYVVCSEIFMEGDSCVDNTDIELVFEYNGWTKSSREAYLCPTLQMAMKWLREDKKILISIFCHIDKGYWFCIQHFIESPYKFATSESTHRKEEILGKIQYYDTYEEACEAAIKYCLENLI